MSRETKTAQRQLKSNENAKFGPETLLTTNNHIKANLND